MQNAGIYPWTLIENISPEEWDRVLAVNLQGHVPRRAGGAEADEGAALWPHGLHVVDHRAARLDSRATATIRRRRPASTASSVPRRSSSPRYGITVNGVEPGNILTEAIKLHRGAEFIANMEAMIPLGRLGTPRDVANAVLYLASDDAEYITGTTIVVDGGQTIPEGSDFRITVPS